MASNYKKEPIFVLERTWDDSTKLPEKCKFQGRKDGKKAEVCIDSGTLGMKFFLDRDASPVQPSWLLARLELAGDVSQV